MSYPLKSTVTRLEVINMLEADTVFNDLTTDQKNNFLNSAVQKVAALRNELGKEDFLADNVSSSTVVVGASLVGTTAERTAYGATLGAGDAGKVMYFDTDDDSAYWWNGTVWV